VDAASAVPDVCHGRAAMDRGRFGHHGPHPVDNGFITSGAPMPQNPLKHGPDQAPKPPPTTTCRNSVRPTDLDPGKTDGAILKRTKYTGTGCNC